MTSPASLSGSISSLLATKALIRAGSFDPDGPLAQDDPSATDNTLGASLDQVLKDPAVSDLFAQFLDNELAHENLEFLQAVAALQTGDPSAASYMDPEVMYDTFIDGKSDKAINIGGHVRKSIDEAKAADELTADSFMAAVGQVRSSILGDTFPRFLRSEELAELAKSNPIAARVAL